MEYFYGMGMAAGVLLVGWLHYTVKDIMKEIDNKMHEEQQPGCNAGDGYCQHKSLPNYLQKQKGIETQTQ